MTLDELETAADHADLCHVLFDHPGWRVLHGKTKRPVEPPNQQLYTVSGGTVIFLVWADSSQRAIDRVRRDDVMGRWKYPRRPQRVVRRGVLRARQASEDDLARWADIKGRVPA